MGCGRELTIQGVLLEYNMNENNSLTPCKAITC